MSLYLFLFKQKTAYEMRISDRSSDVCSSDLLAARPLRAEMDEIASIRLPAVLHWDLTHFVVLKAVKRTLSGPRYIVHDPARGIVSLGATEMSRHWTGIALELAPTGALTRVDQRARLRLRSEEHTSELQSLMRISYAVFCLKKKKKTITTPHISLSNTLAHTH